MYRYSSLTSFFEVNQFHTRLLLLLINLPYCTPKVLFCLWLTIWNSLHRDGKQGGAGASGARLSDALSAGLPRVSAWINEAMLEEGPRREANLWIYSVIFRRLLYSNRATVPTWRQSIRGRLTIQCTTLAKSIQETLHTFLPSSSRKKASLDYSACLWRIGKPQYSCTKPLWKYCKWNGQIMRFRAGPKEWSAVVWMVG